MFTRVKDWWYAFNVCRKYKLVWNPFIRSGHGMYSWTGIIHVNPFDQQFMSTFLHEIGHHVHDKRVNLKKWLLAKEDELRYKNGDMSGWNIYRNLESEAWASRFAVKTGKADKRDLVLAFQTYSATVFKVMNNPVVVKEFSQIVDCVYKCIRRIEK